MISDNIKKNIFDLEYNKNLQYFNNLIILIFTYIIGIFIAFLTKQLNYENGYQLFFALCVSLILFITSSILMLIFKNRMKVILIEIKKLNI